MTRRNDEEPETQAPTLWQRMTAHGMWVFASVVLMLAIGVLFLLPALVVSVTSTIGDPVSELGYGRDLRAFSGAGELAIERNGDDLYNPEHPAYADVDAADFVNPPWYAMLMMPISLVPFHLLWVLWSIAGVGAIWFGVRSLDLKASDRWVAGALLTLAGTLTLFYGQNAFFMSAVLAGAVLLLVRGQSIASGATFALVAFKPHLLLGFVVWWLSELRLRWRVIVWASVWTAVLVGVSALWMPSAWGEFFSMLQSGEDLVVPEREVSLVSAIRLLVGDNTAMFVSLAGLALVGVVSVLLIGIRQARGNLRLLSALSIVASLLIAPRALAYDWMLLLVAAALLVGLGVVSTPLVVGWAAFLGSMLSIGVLLVDFQMEQWDRALSLAPLTLLVVFLGLVARLGDWDPPRGVQAESP